MARALGIVVGLWLLCAISHGDPGDPGDPFTACHEGLRQSPNERRPIGCFYRTARQNGRWDEAARHLSNLAHQLETDGKTELASWVLFNLGRVRLDQGSEEASDLFRRAAAGFAEHGEIEGELYSWINLFLIDQRRGHFDLADQSLARAERLALASGRDDWLSETRIQQARFLRRRGLDLARAERLLLDARERVFPAGSYSSRRNCLMELASVRYDLGALDEARRSYRALFELAEANEDLYTQASALVNLAVVLHALPPRERGVEIVDVTRHALEVARASGNQYAEALAQMLLGRLTGGVEGMAQLAACRARAAELEWHGLEAQCLAQLAQLKLSSAPTEARQRLDEAIRLSAESTEPWDALHFWEPRLDVLWATAPRQQAMEDALLLLDAIEVMREQQASGLGQAGILASWADVYDGLIGRLLAEKDVDPANVEQAFAVRERFRGRLLLDVLRRADAVPVLLKSEPLARRRSALLERIGQVQRRLLGSPLDVGKRREMLAELAGLERDEADLEEELAVDHPRFAVRRSRFVELAELQASLNPRQAVLAFQLGPWSNPYGGFAGGSWVFAITRERCRVHRLNDPSEVEPLVKMFLGLIEQDDERTREASSRLYHQWLSQALDDLPAQVDQLIVLPDRLLHRVPIAMLRPEPTAPPLASRFEITVAPSATLWHGWQQDVSAFAGRAALILADPALPVFAAAVANPQPGTQWLTPSGNFPRLPFARYEGRQARRHVGHESLLLIGEAASEQALKQADLKRFAILHLAAHAEIDPLRPQRSAILLAAGDERQDGLLQPREIVELDLRGRVVVLAACQGASGRMLRGEGVMSLARAFFEAGSRAVVGSLWPLRDDEAAIFFDRFYAHLSRGESVAAALRLTQKNLIEEGHPASTWAGLMVFGDGFFAPLPGHEPWPLTGWILALVLLLLAGWIVRRQRLKRLQKESTP